MTKPLLQPLGRLVLWMGLLTGALHVSGTTTAGPHNHPDKAGALRYAISARSTSNTLSLQYWVPATRSGIGAALNYALPAAPFAITDLSTVLTSPAQAPEGSLVYFKAEVTNNGSQQQTGIVTVIKLPIGLKGVSLSNSGTYDPATGRATFPAFTLAVGQSQERNIAFTMPSANVDGSATYTIEGTITDNTPGNNIGNSSTIVTQQADIEMVINGPTRVVPNQAIVYTVVATNLGPSTATGISLRAQLPPGRTGDILSNNGSYNRSTGVVTWPLANTLDRGANLAYTVRFNAGTTTTNTVLSSASATSTTSGGDPVAANNNGTNPRAQISTQVVSSLATLLCANPGIDGDQRITTPPNTYYPGQGAAVAGTSTVTLGSVRDGGGALIQKDDLVMLMQMQGAVISTTNSDAYGDGIGGDQLGSGNLIDDNFTAGRYEYAIVESIMGNQLTLKSPLVYGYNSAAASATQGQQRFQILRVPRYRNLTLDANIEAPYWGGLTGGIVVLDVDGILDFNGKTLNVKGKGFRGGAGQTLTGTKTGPGITEGSHRHSSTLTTSANKGEGTAGTPRYVNNAGTLLDNTSEGYPEGDRGRGAPGNAGGGGTDGNPVNNEENTGGGGGGNAGRGGQGGNSWNSNQPYGGNGGADFTQATPSRLIMGGGGGAGTTNNGTGTQPNGFASSGAAGGGIVLIRATNVNSTNKGVIDVSGADMTLTPANDGSGGGGAGGSVVLLVNSSDNNPSSSVLKNIVVLANGGKGGSNTGGGSPHGPGGGGGGGIIFASSTLNTITKSDPGANGTSFNSTQYGSGVGSADLGQAQTGITRADVPNLIAGCPADVETTLATSVTEANPGTTVIFTISTRNAGPGTATNVMRTITLVPNLPLADLTLNGATYDPATGVVTLPTIATISVGAPASTASISFKMPNQTVLGTARSTSADDPATGNNDGTADDANVAVVALTQISGTVFDDVNYGGGSGRNLATARTSAEAFGLSRIGSAGTTVELYYGTGAATPGVLVKSTITGPDGAYGFNDIATGMGYQLRVVSSTVKSARTPTLVATDVLPVQTFRVNNGVADPNRVGGEEPGLFDAGIAPTGQKLSDLRTNGATAQSIAEITLVNGISYRNIDFGFNFSTVVNTNSTGQGSLRQFINNSNSLTNAKLDQDPFNGTPATGTTVINPAGGKEYAVFMLNDGRTSGAPAGLRNSMTAPTGYNATTGFTFTLTSELPSITDDNTVIDGSLQAALTGNKVATTSETSTGPEVTLNFNTLKGLFVTGGYTTIANLGLNNAKGSIGTPPVTNSDGAGVTLSGASAVGSTVTGVTTSGNARAGVRVEGRVANVVITNNVLNNNSGINPDADGLELLGATNATVTGNTISNNKGYGIFMTSTVNTGNTISDNIIRGNGTGSSAGADAGISIGALSTNNTFSRNIITGNVGDGIVALSGSSGNRFTQNSISGNGDLGIDLSVSDTATGDGVTKNADGKTAARGANSLLNFPVIYQATIFNGKLELAGYAPQGSTIEFFVSDKTTAAFGQGRTYLFTATEGSAADLTARTGSYSGIVNGLDQGSETGAQIFVFTIPISSFTQGLQDIFTISGTRLTATATLNQATSEFSGNIIIARDAPLPVTLVSFAAKAAGLDARLDWKTAQELNNDYFVVERSFDGQRFEEVGRKPGQGTSAQAHSYQLTDTGIGSRAIGQPIYYRLRQVDLDGTASYSSVQTVYFGTMPGVAVWPTPTNSDAVLQLSSLPTGSYQVQVYDATGRLVHSTTAPGGQPLPLASATWPRGTYLVRVTGAGSTHVTQLVKL